MKIHWREGATADPPFHAYVRVNKNSVLGMNFDSLCGRFWMGTVKHGKPTPYPPAEKDRCPACVEKLP